MAYRDELEAAQRRIQHLEAELRATREEERPPPSPDAPPPSRAAASTKVLGVGLVAVLVSMVVILPNACTHGCAAVADEETEPALAALRACPAAKELLGDDLTWAWIGCANVESQSGGDPLNGGCHSSSSWTMPVAGSRGRGSFEFSTAQPPGRGPRLVSGRLASGGRVLTISGAGCTELPR